MNKLYKDLKNSILCFINYHFQFDKELNALKTPFLTCLLSPWLFLDSLRCLFRCLGLEKMDFIQKTYKSSIPSGFCPSPDTGGQAAGVTDLQFINFSLLEFKSQKGVKLATW